MFSNTHISRATKPVIRGVALGLALLGTSAQSEPNAQLKRIADQARMHNIPLSFAVFHTTFRRRF